LYLLMVPFQYNRCSFVSSGDAVRTDALAIIAHRPYQHQGEFQPEIGSQPPTKRRDQS
jgi:hypothetical protein